MHTTVWGLNVYKKDGPLFKTKPAAAAGPYIYGATLTPRARVMHFQPFKLAGNPFLPLCAPSERVIHGRAPHPKHIIHRERENRTAPRVRFHKVELHALGRVRIETVFKACIALSETYMHNRGNPGASAKIFTPFICKLKTTTQMIFEKHTCANGKCKPNLKRLYKY
jgi:hypothetical protein